MKTERIKPKYSVLIPIKDYIEAMKVAHSLRAMGYEFENFDLMKIRMSNGFYSCNYIRTFKDGDACYNGSDFPNRHVLEDIETGLALSSIWDDEIPHVGEYLIRNVDSKYELEYGYKAGDIVKVRRTDGYSFDFLEKTDGSTYDTSMYYGRETMYRKPTQKEIIDHFKNKKAMKNDDMRFPFDIGLDLFQKYVQQSGCQKKNLIKRHAVELIENNRATITEEEYNQLRKEAGEDRKNKYHVLLDEIFGPDPITVIEIDINVYRNGKVFGNGKGKLLFETMEKLRDAGFLVNYSCYDGGKNNSDGNK